MLLAFAEYLAILYLANVFEASFDQLADLFQGSCDFRDEIVLFEVDQVSVD
jgi:hypothetical protein